MNYIKSETRQKQNTQNMNPNPIKTNTKKTTTKKHVSTKNQNEKCNGKQKRLVQNNCVKKKVAEEESMVLNLVASGGCAWFGDRTNDGFLNGIR